jgi:methionyl-tRNA formyltransferase
VVKVVFYGTPGFAVPALTRLFDSPHRIAAVVTQPDRRRGRGQRLAPPATKEIAAANRIPVLQPERPAGDAFLGALRELQPDLAVVAAYGRLIPDAVLAVPRLGTINIHPSLLPKYRGAAPVHRAIIAGEVETGVTIMRLVREMDAGPMFAHKTRPIGPDETSEAVEADLARLGADLLLQVIHAIETGAAMERAQDHGAATFAPRLSREDGNIDWHASAAAIHNLVRGLHPWPHAAGVLGGSRYLIHRTATVLDPRSHAPAPGTIVEASGDRLLVSTGDGGALAILEIQPEGRRRLDTRAFLAGRRWSPGQRFDPTVA